MHSPEVLEGRRRAWGCDCDGVSHTRGSAGGMEHAVIERMRKGIAEIIGSEPPTCPWRAFYDPLVSEVIQLSPYDEKGNLAVKVGTDPPEILLDALDAYRLAKSVMLSHIEHQRAKKRG